MAAGCHRVTKKKLREPVFRGLAACPERFPFDYLFGLLRFSVFQAV